LVKDGRVGIGADPVDYGVTLAVNGQAAKPGGGDWAALSDRRLKKDIEPLLGALDRVLALRGVTFEYNDPHTPLTLPGRQVGFIAQDVEGVFPEWVSEGENGYKYVAPRGFQALIVEALRELRQEKEAQIRALQDESATLRARLAVLEARLGMTTSSSAASTME